jgi:alpha-1,3-mannosyl-glycoprotein beta-1,2-N-acetylglucosaminyltransferase
MKYGNRRRRQKRSFFTRPSTILLGTLACCCLSLWGYIGWTISLSLGRRPRLSNLVPPSTIESLERPILRRGHRNYEKLTDFVAKEKIILNKPLKKFTNALKAFHAVTDTKKHDEMNPPIQVPIPPPPLPPPPLASLPNNNKNLGVAPIQPPPISPPTHLPLPSGKTALVVICFNRPTYLHRTLKGVLKYYHQGIDLFVSQDGRMQSVSNTIAQFIHDAKNMHHVSIAEHLHHDNNIRGNGYEKLAVHFGWVLNALMSERGYDRVILLEDDMDIAPDFFEFFIKMAPLYDQDSSIMAVSAFNDNGFKEYVHDPTNVLRSDYFPGLGWMINQRMWKEWGPKWPRGYWDDWLREPPQRKGRITLRPEISRTFTFGKIGVSSGQFYNKYLGRIQLNSIKVNWYNLNVDLLVQKQKYDTIRTNEIQLASLISLSTARQMIHDTTMIDQTKHYKVEYNSLEKGGGISFMRLARELNIMDSVKALIPRTDYMGSLFIRFKGTDRKLYIVESSNFRKV